MLKPSTTPIPGLLTSYQVNIRDRRLRGVLVCMCTSVRACVCVRAYVCCFRTWQSLGMRVVMGMPAAQNSARMVV